MTPAEVAAKLRVFNDWRRGDEDIPQFDPCQIGEAIDAAAFDETKWKLVPIEPTQEMINHVIDERLEALVAGKEHTFIDIYKAMLAAAPKPEGE